MSKGDMLLAVIYDTPNGRRLRILESVVCVKIGASNGELRKWYEDTVPVEQRHRKGKTS